MMRISRSDLWRAQLAAVSGDVLGIADALALAGPRGQEAAEALRSAAEQRDVSYAQVRRLVEELISTLPAFSARDVPQLALPVVEQLSAVMGRPGASVAGIVDAKGRLVGRWQAGIDAAVAERLSQSTGLLGSSMAHELLRWEVEAGHRQWHAQQDSPHIIEVDGGWEGLGLQLGKPARRVDYQHIVQAQQHVRMRLSDGSFSGGLLTYRDFPAVGHRRARLRLELASALMPLGVHEVEDRRQRKLVPLTNPPPIYARRRHDLAGPQLALQMRFMMLVRERVKEYREHGVLVRAGELARLSDGLGMGSALTEAVWTHWQHDAEDAARFVERVEGDAFRLALPWHGAAHEALVASAEYEQHQRKRGQKSVAMRRRR